MNVEFIITIIFAIFSLAINIYQTHREDRVKGKIKSWLESLRGIHSVSKLKGVEEISHFTNSLVVDLKDELENTGLWGKISFILFLLTLGILIGMLIFK